MCQDCRLLLLYHSTNFVKNKVYSYDEIQRLSWECLKEWEGNSNHSISDEGNCDGCGESIKYKFPIINIVTGKTFNFGSTCIVSTWGTTDTTIVNGETGEMITKKDDPKIIQDAMTIYCEYCVESLKLGSWTGHLKSQKHLDNLTNKVRCEKCDKLHLKDIVFQDVNYCSLKCFMEYQDTKYVCKHCLWPLEVENKNWKPPYSVCNDCKKQLKICKTKECPNLRENPKYLYCIDCYRKNSLKANSKCIDCGRLFNNGGYSWKKHCFGCYKIKKIINQSISNFSK